MRKTDFSWPELTTEETAKRLLGCELVSTISNETVRLKIVEVEAYDQNDKASHTFRGRSSRNESMFKSAGHLYVYFTYGLHYCINII